MSVTGRQQVCGCLMLFAVTALMLTILTLGIALGDDVARSHLGCHFFGYSLDCPTSDGQARRYRDSRSTNNNTPYYSLSYVTQYHPHARQILTMEQTTLILALGLVIVALYAVGIHMRAQDAFARRPNDTATVATVDSLESFWSENDDMEQQDRRRRRCRHQGSLTCCMILTCETTIHPCDDTIRRCHRDDRTEDRISIHVTTTTRSVDEGGGTVQQDCDDMEGTSLIFENQTSSVLHYGSIMTIW